MLVAVAQRGHGHLAGFPGRAEVVAHHLQEQGRGRSRGWILDRQQRHSNCVERNPEQPAKLGAKYCLAHLGFQDRHPGAVLSRLGNADKGIALAKSILVLQLDSGQCQLDLQQKEGGGEVALNSRPLLSAPPAQGQQAPTSTARHMLTTAFVLGSSSADSTATQPGSGRRCWSTRGMVIVWPWAVSRSDSRNWPSAAGRQAKRKKGGAVQGETGRPCRIGSIYRGQGQVQNGKGNRRQAAAAAHPGSLAG